MTFDLIVTLIMALTRKRMLVWVQGSACSKLEDLCCHGSDDNKKTGFAEHPQRKETQTNKCFNMCFALPPPPNDGVCVSYL